MKSLLAVLVFLTSGYAQAIEPQLSHLFSFEAAPASAGGANLTNGSLAYAYGPGNTVQFSLGWQAPLFHSIVGSLWLGENLSYMGFNGQPGPGAAASSLLLNVLGFDTSLTHQWDFFPWKRLIPFIRGGAVASAYFQTGSPQDFCGGAVVNPEVGAGLLFWINRGSADSTGRFLGLPPILLVGRVERVFPAMGSDGGLALTSTLFYGGLAFSL